MAEKGKSPLVGVTLSLKIVTVVTNQEPLLVSILID